MALREQLLSELRNALKAGDTARVSVLRLLAAQIRNAELKPGATALSDTEVQRIVQQEIKKRTEAAESYRAGQREEAARREEAERGILEQYLPAQLSDAALEQIVRDAVVAGGVSHSRAAGPLMGKIMASVRGQADGARVSAMLDRVLSSTNT